MPDAESLVQHSRSMATPGESRSGPDRSQTTESIVPAHAGLPTQYWQILGGVLGLISPYGSVPNGTDEG